MYSHASSPATDSSQEVIILPPGDNAYGAPTAGSLDFRRLVGSLWQYRLLIAGIVAAFLLLGIAVTFLMTPMYTASATLQIDQEEQRILDAEDQAASAAYQDADRFLQTNVDVLRSRRMAERVAEEMGLFDNDEFLDLMNIDPPGEDEPNPELARRDEVLETIEDNLDIGLPQDSRVVRVSFTSPNPAFSAQFANTFVASYLRYNIERRLDKTAYARDFLSRQLEEARERLQNAEREANDYARNTGLVRLPSATPGVADTTITTIDLGRYNDALAEARTDRIAAESRWNSVARAPDYAIAEALQNNAMQDLIAERARVQSLLEAELAVKQPTHPTVIPLQKQLDEYDAQISRLAAGVRASIRDAYRIAAERESELQDRVNSLKGDTQAERDRSVQLNTLTREVESSRELYDGFLQRFRTLSAEANITSNNVQQIDIAQQPIEPSSPNLLLNLLLSLIAGVGVAGFVIFLREQMDDRLRTANELEEKLGLKLLGITPALKDGESPIEAMEDRKAPLTESFYSLRTALQFAVPSGLPPRMLVTSTRQGEGKSSTAFGIAKTMADGGKRVLLIDCDLRRPSVHRAIGTDNDTGLVTVLTTDAPLSSVVRETDIESFGAVTSGPLPMNPSDLLASHAFVNLLATIEDQYDLVVLDAPPVMGLADAPILSAIPNTATVFVVEAEDSHRGAARNALRRLSSAGANVVGGVFTQFDFAKAKRLGLGGGTDYSYSYYEYGS
ncbi:GumC family protein [Qipengyuania seohaensis]|uniref:GumC family protein n=1 Tax=Qipengyuania seohaensis TaxID=266951 RepID=UPI000C21BA33|nr:polysaccharide biosynthesis tyrosine autokinase [Qipengyuania seohaensis]